MGGLLAGVLMTLAIVTLLALVPAFGVAIPGFLEAMATGTAFAILVLAATILALPFFLVLSRILRGTSPILAPFGSALGTLSLVLFAFSLPGHYWLWPYLLWGGLFLGLSFLSLGAAMQGSRVFPYGFGVASGVLGVVGGVSTFFIFNHPAPLVVVILAPAIFLFLLGGKVYTLSRTPSPG